MSIPFPLSNDQPRKVYVTPEMARDFLKKNTHNRRLNARSVERFARDMKSGNWQYTHQGIALSPDGTIIDGQHRLAAIVASNVGIHLLVSYNQSFATQMVVDNGGVRRPEDAIRLGLGIEVHKDHIAIARTMMSVGGNNVATYFEIADFISAHNEAISFSDTIFPTHVRGVTTSLLLASVARAWYTEDRQRLAEFAECIMSSIARSDGDLAAIRLREAASKLRRDSQSWSREDWYGRGENAIRHFLDRRPIQALYAAKEELFLLPGETRSVVGHVVKPKKKSKGFSPAIAPPATEGGAA